MVFLKKIKDYLREKPLRLTQIIILLTGVVLAFSYVLFFKSSMDNVRDNATFLRLGIVETSQTEIENFINTNIAALTELSKKIDLTDDPSERQDLIEKIMRERNWMTEITVADQEGNETMDISKYSISNIGSNKSMVDTEEFQTAKGGKLYLGKVHTDDKSIPILTIGLPIQRSDVEVSGVVIAQLSLQEIWNIISDSKLITPEQKVFIVNSGGFLISHPDTSMVLKKTNWLSKSYINEVVTDKKIVAGDEYINENNQSIFVVGLPMDEKLGWGIFVEEPVSSALAIYQKIKTAALIFIFLTFLLLLILIINSRTLGNVFSDFNAEVKKRNRELQELDKTTKLLVRRDLDLSEANQRLEELDTVKSDFVSIAAHQLRTPLTGIKWSFLALLEKETGQLNNEQKKIIEDGMEAINHTITLINDLLNVAHIEEGKFGFNFQNTSIIFLAQKSFERFESLAGDKGVWLTVDFPKDPLPSVSLDPEKISLVLDNLLDNAIKYTSPGGKIMFKIKHENKALKITVSDTGIGIPQSQISRVFSKFFRGENAILFQTSGTGLGLYMVKNIIDRHCGTISVESEENKGTTFTVTLPEVCGI